MARLREPMSWLQFRSIAFPSAQAATEAKRSVVWRANRWLGLRFAYVFYRLGFSANLLSIVRVLLALIGFAFLVSVTTGDKWLPLLGILILAWQINLDYADGPIARVQGKSSELGEKIDGLANASARAVMLVLAGYLTGSMLLFLVSAFSAYILVTFMPASRLRFITSGKWKIVALIYRSMLYVPVMNLGLPLIIGTHWLVGIDLVVLASVITYSYAVLAVLWLVLMLYYADNGRVPFEKYQITGK